MTKSLFHLFLVVFSVLLSITSSRAADENVIIVLDASGSMWGQIDGKPKMEIARDVMSEVLSNLDGKANIGVITYGHRTKGDCSDIETIIPVGRVNHRTYMSVINNLSPKGKTPITNAVRKAAEELRYTENKATIVLVSDGLETCEADPCALARELESNGIDFTVHVIGFDLINQDTSSLRCLAEETGGQYLAADNARELGNAVGTVVAQAPAPEPKPEPQPAKVPTTLTIDVRLAKGTEPLRGAYAYIIPATANKNRKKAVSRGASYRAHKVDPGTYYIEVQLGNIVASTEFDVKADQENRADIILDAGLLSIRALAAEGGQPIEKAYIYVYEPTPQANGKRKRITAGNQRNTFTLPAGKYYFTATHGQAIAGQEVEILPGKKTDTVIILASGLLQVSVFEEEGGKPVTKGAYVYIYKNEKQTDGKRKRITAANPRNKFSLPIGTYYVEAQIGNAKASKTIDVIADMLTQTSIVIGVGAFKAKVIPAEGGKPLKKAYIYIYAKNKQLDGSRKRITGANQRTTFKLPAGTYHVVAQLDKAKMSQEIEVTAGKLSEATINLNAGALLIEASKKLYVYVYTADKNLDGTRDRITTMRPGKTLMLPAGKYFLVAKVGSQTIEAEVEIKAGKLKEVSMKP